MKKCKRGQIKGQRFSRTAKGQNARKNSQREKYDRGQPSEEMQDRTNKGQSVR